MSELVLVRHAQATPFEAETDRLSALGVRQAEALADFWRQTGIAINEVHSGTLQRHVRTAEVVAQRMHAGGHSWPAAAAGSGFNEYDGEGIVGVLARRLADRDPQFDGLVEAARASRGTAEQNRHFQRMVEYVADRWLCGELTDPAVESWQAFCARVDAAIDRVLDGGRVRASASGPGGGDLSGRRVAIFTSGGVIGRTLQRVLGAPDQTALALNWRIGNASLTHLTFSGRRVSLDSFNVTTHLRSAGLDSYR